MSKLLEEYEVDAWFALGKHNELNVFSTENGSLYFNLYPVVDGEIDTQHMISSGYINNTEKKK